MNVSSFIDTKYYIKKDLSMKAIEILAESRKVNEAPANIVGQGLKRLGAGVLGAMGAKGMAGSLAGSADQGAKANELNGNFQRYLGQIGKNSKTAEYADLQAFLKKNKLDAKLAKGQGPIDQKTLDGIFTQMAQSSFKGTTPSTPASSTASASNTSQTANIGSTNQQSTQSSAGQYPATQARKDADALIKNISSVRSRDRQKIVDYIKQQLDTLAKSATSAPSTTAPASTNTPAPTANTTTAKPTKKAAKTAAPSATANVAV